jgi:putative inorganic carbon (HCO3(-)) transporter
MKGLVLTYIVTWIAAFASLWDPLAGLYVYMCFAVLRPQFVWGWAGDLSGLSLLVGAAVLVGWVFRGLGSWRFGKAQSIVLALITFGVWFVLSSFLALSPARSWPLAIELSKLIFPFLVGITLITGERQWRAMLWTLVLAQGYVGLEMNINYLVKGYNTAADGFGGMDNNCFAVSLVTVLGPAIALMISARGWWKRALAGASAALILHTILLTFSRGGMIGLLAVGATAFVMMPKRPKYLAVLALTAVIALRFVGPQLASRYATAFVAADQRDSSAESRLDLWNDCLKVIERYPVFGVGPGNWGMVAASYGWPAGKSAHSVWMETAAEIGLPAALILLFFFVRTAVGLWPIARAPITEENRYEVVLASGAILSIVGFAVSGQFVSIPGLEVPYYLVMVAAAMLKSRAPTAPAVLTARSAPAVRTLPVTGPAPLAPRAYSRRS